jgi:polyferredoxin
LVKASYRKIVQWAALLGSNAYLDGFRKGRIYKGELKSVCLPGLNCYSCPGALTACPLGALQAVISSYRYSFSFYITGLLLAFGVILGRFVCGFLCPFGLLQELLHKAPFIRLKRLPGALTYVKYIMLAVFVVGMPALAKGDLGISSPAFCKYICPAGTLTAGLPLLAANASLREAAGWLFAFKIAIAAFTIIGCLAVFRFFCKVLCPLGAIYGLFNGLAVYRIRLAKEKCIHCGACVKTCKMAVDPSRAPNSPECIRCGDCVRACPSSALNAGFFEGRQRERDHGRAQLS